MNFKIISTCICFLLLSCQKTENGNTTTIKVVPLPPTDLTANRISISEVGLNWVDKSTNEDGFKIERKTSSTQYKLIATLNPDITSYRDTGITVNQTYTYRVYSFNTVGNSITYSNEVTISSIDTETGLIAFFPFTGNPNDSSGNNIITNNNGATLTKDRFNSDNSAYSFSNTADNSITGQLKTPLGTTFTISFWAKRNSTIVPGPLRRDKEWIFASGNGSTGSATSIGLTNGSNFLRYGPWGSDGISSNFLVTGNTWIHYLQTYSNGEFKLFVNGSIVSTNKTSINISNTTFSIGCQLSPFLDEGFNGVIDDVRIYNRILTDEQIKLLSKN